MNESILVLCHLIIDRGEMHVLLPVMNNDVCTLVQCTSKGYFMSIVVSINIERYGNGTAFEDVLYWNDLLFRVNQI